MTMQAQCSDPEEKCRLTVEQDPDFDYLTKLNFVEPVSDLKLDALLRSKVLYATTPSLGDENGAAAGAGAGNGNGTGAAAGTGTGIKPGTGTGTVTRSISQPHLVRTIRQQLEAIGESELAAMQARMQARVQATVQATDTQPATEAQANEMTCEHSLKVGYKLSKGGEAKYGRVYPARGVSLGEVSGRFRHYLLGEHWTAFDFANCHPNILCQLIKQNGREVPNLSRYCSAREEALQDVMTTYKVDRKAAKNLFIRLLYQGTFRTWAKDHITAGKAGKQVAPTSFVKGFEEEMQQICQVVAHANPKLRQALASCEQQRRGPGRPSKKRKVQEGQDGSQASVEQTVSYVCQEYERRALTAFFRFLCNEGVLVLDSNECYRAMLRYDGIDVLKADLGPAVTDNKAVFFQKASAFIERETGLRLEVTEKEYDQPAPLAEQIEHEANLDDIPEKDIRVFNIETLRGLKDYERQKAYFERFASKILQTSNYMFVYRDLAREIDNPTQMSDKNLFTSFGHIDTYLPDEKTPVSFIKRWIRDPNMKTYYSITFWPYNLDTGDASPSRAFNMFRGFPVPHNVHVPPAEAFKLLEAFHYIGIQLCGGDAFNYQFLWYCLAHNVQNPATRLSHAIVFQNKPQGAGADSYFDAIGRAVFGLTCYSNSSSLENYIGKHAEGLVGKKLVVINELELHDSTVNQSRIKELITCSRIMVDPKHQRPYEIEVFAFIVFFSNRLNAINFDNNDNERRFVLFQANDTCCNGFAPEDWTYLHTTLFQSPIFKRALYDELLRVDLTGWDPKHWREITLSQAYFRSSARNAPLHAKFFADYVRNLAKEAGMSGVGRSIASSIRHEPLASWELEHMDLIDREFKVPQSTIHQDHDNFKAEMTRTTGTSGRLDREFVLSKYPGIISSKKSGVLHYVFNPRKLWRFLLEKRWVSEEGFLFHCQKMESARASAKIDPHFDELSRAAAEEIGGKRPL